MKKRGIGIGSMWYGIGNTGLPNPAGAFVEILDDGTANVLTGCADIGQGSTTILAQIAAEEIGIDVDDVTVVSADTRVTPDAGATSASRQTYISGNAVKIAAMEAKKNIIKMAAELLNVSEKEVVLQDKIFQVSESSEDSENLLVCKDECRSDLGLDKNKNESAHANNKKTISLDDCLKKCRAQGILTIGHGWFNPEVTSLDPETGQGNPYATYAFATQFAEVEVDTKTGEVNVLQIVAAHDVGKAINPINIEGQIEGGCMMGLGYGLMEEIIMKEGIVQNPNFTNYIIPTSLDTPVIYPLIVEDTEISGPFGAKGVGEPALIPTAAAITNAVYDAIGVRIRELPITPEKILAKLEQKAYPH